MSDTMISGRSPPSRPKMTSTMYRESRIVPDTTFAPRPMPRSFMAFSQVMPHFEPKYLRLGRVEAALNRYKIRVRPTPPALRTASHDKRRPPGSLS